MSEGALLKIQSLMLVIGDEGGMRPVDGIDFEVGRDEIFGLVGESGSGKTLTTRAILGLLPRGIEFINGSIELNGKTFGPQSPGGRRPGVSLIPQHASAALNPLVKVGRQVGASLRARGVLKQERHHQTLDLLASLGLKQPRRIAASYPHELSGGQQQRVVVAAALASEPALLIADEPTSALDPVIRLQFLDLLASVQRQRSMSILLVTHDLGVVARSCDRVAVMYAGRIMETGTVSGILSTPRHPYTQGLLRATPSIDSDDYAVPIVGKPRGASIVGDACPFAPRCEQAHAICLQERPPDFPVASGHISSCWLADDNVRRGDVNSEGVRI